MNIFADKAHAHRVVRNNTHVHGFDTKCTLKHTNAQMNIMVIRGHTHATLHNFQHLQQYKFKKSLSLTEHNLCLIILIIPLTHTCN